MTYTPGDWTGTLNGLAIGSDTPYPITEVHGWLDMNAAPLGGASSGGSATLPAPNPGGNGSWNAPNWMPERVVTLLLDIEESGSTTFQQAVDQLLAATPPAGSADLPLALQIGGLTTQVTGKITSRVLDLSPLAYTAGLSNVNLEVTCADPRRLATTAVTGQAAAAGTIALTNAGSAAGPLTFTVTGPLTGLTLTNQTTGHVWTLKSAAAIASGHTVTIDMERRTVTDTTDGNIANLVSSRGWFNLAPGTNTIAVGAASGAGTVSATGYSAWI